MVRRSFEEYDAHPASACRPRSRADRFGPEKGAIWIILQGMGTAGAISPVFGLMVRVEGMGSQSDETLKEAYASVAEEMAAFETGYAAEFQNGYPFMHPLLIHVGRLHGKRLRPLLFFLCQGLAGKVEQKSIPVAVLLELLHVATLIHDDVVDGSGRRRGEDTLNEVWGNKAAVLVGDYLFSRVLALGVQLQWKNVLEIVSRLVMNMGVGELREAFTCGFGTTEEEYYQIVREKTGGFFSAACEMAAVIKGLPDSEIRRYSSFGEAFGILFQIRDDILDLDEPGGGMGKPGGQDLANGCITLPVILAIRDATDDERKALPGQGDPFTSRDIPALKALIRRRRGIEQAQDQANRFAGEALQILSRFRPSRYKDALEKLVIYGLNRTW